MLVLCYHALSARWPAPLASTPQQLRSHLEHLAGHGFVGATFTDAVLGRAGGRAVAITFDDAYRSVLEIGAPILEEIGWPATVFVPTSFPARREPMCWDGIDHWLGTEHEDELLPLDWDELRGLRDRGWEIGSHTCSHPHLPSIGDADLRRELEDSRATVLEEIGSCASIAYPYGELDDRVVRATRAAGYTTGAALADRADVLSETLRWPRVGVYRPDEPRRFRLKISRPARRLARSGGLRLLHRGRRAR